MLVWIESPVEITATQSQNLQKSFGASRSAGPRSGIKGYSVICLFVKLMITDFEPRDISRFALN